MPYTGLLDNLSKHPVQEIINRVLKNDAKRALDAMAWAQFYSTPLKIYPSAASGSVGTDTTVVLLNTTGTSTWTNSVAMHKDHIKSIVDVMKERNVPPYMGLYTQSPLAA